MMECLLRGTDRICDYNSDTSHSLEGYTKAEKETVSARACIWAWRKDDLP
jgi:hypothetical protein